MKLFVYADKFFSIGIHDFYEGFSNIILIFSCNINRIQSPRLCTSSTSISPKYITEPVDIVFAKLESWPFFTYTCLSAL